MVLMPIGNAAVVIDAAPPTSVTVCRIKFPSKNVTVPVGVWVLEPEGETVTLKTTACPKVEGFTDDFTTVVVLRNRSNAPMSTTLFTIRAKPGPR